MKKLIILPLAALMALLSCAERGNEFDNPWDKRGSNYRGDDPCFVDPNGPDCVGPVVGVCDNGATAACCAAQPSYPGCQVQVDPCLTNPTGQGCQSYCVAYPEASECDSGATFVDSRDNKTYKKVVIGTQTWMGENLNYNASGSVCYGNSADSCAKYGRLYNWPTAMGGASSSNNSPSGVQGVCPVGWHIPSYDEWSTLVDYAGGSLSAGGKLKSTSGWYNNGNGTDQYGFSALPGGNGSSDGILYYAGNYGYWWSATEDDAYAWGRSMGYNYEYVGRGSNNKASLFSVRCVADAGTQTPTTYTITFDANGGSVSPASGTTGEDGRFASLPTPVMSGYTFAGWYTATTGGEQVTAGTVFGGDGTIYARWNASSGYELLIEVFPATGPMTAATKLTEVTAGESVRVLVTPRKIGENTPFPSVLKEVEFQLLSDPSAFMYYTATNQPLTYYKPGISEMVMVFPVYFEKAGNEVILGAGLYESGANRLAFLGNGDIKILPGVP